MRRSLALVPFSLLALSAFAATPKELLERGIRAMGDDRVAKIAVTTVELVGHTYAVEQSERPTGPFITTYEKTSETIDFLKQTQEVTQEANGLMYGGQPFKGTTKTDLLHPAGNPVGLVSTARRMVLGPERILYTALHASDLTAGREIVYQGVPHQTLHFHWGKVPVTVLINLWTALPSAVETVEQMPGFHAIWGDSTIRQDWGLWQLSKEGVLFPLQWVTTVNGFVENDLTVLDVKFKLNGFASFQNVAYPEVAGPNYGAYAAGYKKAELAPGVFQYSGPFNTNVVDQGDGLVVIEPVINSVFAKAFLDRIATDFPNRKVQTVVASSDAWPHLGGARTFIARGIPIVTNALNEPIFRRLAAAPYTISPDELAQAKQAPKFRLVKGKTEIGKGANRMVVYPLKGEGSERMVMVYFPEHELLYGSDLLQPQPDGSYFFPAYPLELVQVVEREGLKVKTVFGMHCPPTPWSKVVEYIRGFRPAIKP